MEDNQLFNWGGRGPEWEAIQRRLEQEALYEQAVRIKLTQAGQTGGVGGGSKKQEFSGLALNIEINDPLNEKVNIYMQAPSDLNSMRVDWGDGLVEDVENDDGDYNFYHEYASSGTYQVRISGSALGSVFYAEIYAPFTDVNSIDFTAFAELNRLGLGSFLDTSVNCENIPATVTELSVSSTNLTTFSCELASLVELNLNSTSVSQSGFSISLPALERLYLSQNQFTSFDFLDPLVSSLTNLFLNQNPISSISWPTATHIPSGSFADITDPISVSIPLATTAGEGCFSYCSGLTSISLPALETAESGAFYACDNLTSVSLPSLTTAGGQVFSQCLSLTSISLPSLETITGDYFFGSCSSLSSVSLPSLVNTGFGTFFNCTSLSTVSLPSLISTGVGCFQNCSGLAAISLPSAENVENGCFATCTSLTDIELPVCTNLGDNVGNNRVFFNISGNTITLTVPSALMTCNAGGPDGDIATLQANNTVTVVTV